MSKIPAPVQAAEVAIKRALADELTGLSEPVAAEATICKAAREAVEAATPFILAAGISMAAREITGNDRLSRDIRERLGSKADSLTRRAIVATKERNAS